MARDPTGTWRYREGIHEAAGAEAP